MKKIFLLLLLGFLFSAGFAQAASWKIDPDHSAARFTIKHMTVSNVHGSFGDVTGEAVFDTEDLKKFALDITVGIDSIDTGVQKRDDHLRSADFFEVARYPVMHFVATKVVNAGEESYLVTGNLTMHGITKEVSVTLNGPTPEVKDPWGNIRKGAEITTQLNRKDFGLVYNKVLDNGGLLIGDIANVSVELEFIKK